jgi:hypothetical protein
MRSTRPTTHLAEALVRLYPEPWRERYENEMLALLEDDPPGLRAASTILSGALGAHLRPQRAWRESAPAPTLMRLSVGALFACWILLSLAGIGFAKETEGFSPAESAYPLLAAGRYAIMAGAALGSIAVALGGLPLLWHGLGEAIRRRDRALAGMIASPLVAVALFAAFTAVLIELAPTRHAGFPAGFVLEILVPFTLAGHACALVCAWAPKAVMRRSRPSRELLRLACWAGQALTLAMLCVGGGLLVYVATLWRSVPDLAGEPSGPFGASVEATLCLSLAGALAACAMALVASSRARRAATLTD